MDWSQIWTIVGANIVLTLACIGTAITLFLWARSEGNQDRKHIVDLIISIQNEMKDFHGRLEKIDAEHKTKMELIEAQHKNRIDAINTELTTHLKQDHKKNKVSV